MLDVGEHLRGEVVGAGELAMLEQPAGEDREEDLDLVKLGGFGETIGETRRAHSPSESWSFFGGFSATGRSFASTGSTPAAVRSATVMSFAADDLGEQRVLLRFKIDEQRDDVEQVDEFDGLA